MWASHCGGYSHCGAPVLGCASAVAALGLQSIVLVVVAQGLICSTAHGIFLDQGLNLSLLLWQVDSLLLSHPGGTADGIFKSRYEINTQKSLAFLYTNSEKTEREIKKQYHSPLQQKE